MARKSRKDRDEEIYERWEKELGTPKTTEPLRLVKELQKLSIRPKAGGICKLVFDKNHKAQKRLVAMVVKYRKLHKPIRFIVLKRRQLGSSTLCMAILFVLTWYHEQRSAQLVAHRRSTAQKIWNMIKRFYKFQDPADQKPLEGGKPHKHGLEYEYPHGSECNALTAGGDSIGHGETTHYNVWTEFSRWPNPEESLDGLMHVVPSPEETWDSIIIIETTANGSGDIFQQMWDHANERHSDSDWVPIFLGIKDDPLAQLEIGPNESFILDEEEQAYALRWGMTLPQMKWVRKTRRDRCRDNWDKFNEQYPVDPSVAFAFAGFPVFDAVIVQEMLNDAPEPIFTGDIVIAEGPEFTHELKPMKHGPVTVYKMPDPDCTYSLGVDSADGRKQDFTVAKVICDQTDEEVATFRSNTTYPTAAGIKIMLLGQMYNYAFLGVERTSSGSTILSVCEFGLDLDGDVKIPAYPNLYYETVKDKKTQEVKTTLGFTTSAKSKKRIIERLSEAVGERELTVFSRVTLIQMSGFVNDPDAVGKRRWKQNKKDLLTNLPNDDDIIALAIAWEMKNTQQTFRYASGTAKVVGW